MCYNFSEDVMAKYGDKLIATHFNDNMKMHDPTVVTWHDDLHLLPFDGRMDLGRVARQIRESGYRGPLTLEIHATNSDKYNFMTLQAFLERAALSIKRLRSMVDFETP
jgi:sugar phosphate isomerase/epimerase